MGRHALGDPKLSTVTLCNELKMAIGARTSMGKVRVVVVRAGGSSILNQRLVGAAAGGYVHRRWQGLTAYRVIYCNFPQAIPTIKQHCEGTGSFPDA